MAAQPQKRFGAHAFCVRQLGDIVQRRALCVGEQGTSPVLLQSVEFGLIHRSLDRKRPPNINAEKTNVNPRHLLANQHDGLYLLFCSFDSRRDSMLRPPEARLMASTPATNGSVKTGHCKNARLFTHFRWLSSQQDGMHGRISMPIWTVPEIFACISLPRCWPLVR